MLITAIAASLFFTTYLSPHNPDKGKQVVSNDTDVVNSQTEVIGKTTEVGVKEPEVGVVSSEVGVNSDTKAKANNSSHTARGFLETEISRLIAGAAIWHNSLVYAGGAALWQCSAAELAGSASMIFKQ